MTAPRDPCMATYAMIKAAREIKPAAVADHIRHLQWPVNELAGHRVHLLSHVRSESISRQVMSWMHLLLSCLWHACKGRDR